MEKNKDKTGQKIQYLGRYSNSQNGNVYGIDGISPCLCSGGSGHDATIPKVLLYETDDIEDICETSETSEMVKFSKWFKLNRFRRV